MNNKKLNGYRHYRITAFLCYIILVIYNHTILEKWIKFINRIGEFTKLLQLLKNREI